MLMGRRLRNYGPFYLRFLAVLYSSEVLATLLLERRLWERLLSKLVLAVCIWFCLQWNRRIRFLANICSNKCLAFLLLLERRLWD